MDDLEVYVDSEGWWWWKSDDMDMSGGPFLGRGDATEDATETRILLERAE